MPNTGPESAFVSAGSRHWLAIKNRRCRQLIVAQAVAQRGPAAKTKAHDSNAIGLYIRLGSEPPIGGIDIAVDLAVVRGDDVVNGAWNSILVPLRKTLGAITT